MDWLQECRELYNQGKSDEEIGHLLERRQAEAYLPETQFLLEGGLTKPEIKSFWKALDTFEHQGNSGGDEAFEGSVLTDLEEAFKSLSIKVMPGWQNRGRPFTNNRVEGISLHTAGDTELMDSAVSIRHMCYMADHKPLANIYVSRDGTWWLLAAGTTNACGKGGPWYKIPPGQADNRTISVYIGNNAKGEPLPIAQQLSLTEGLATLWNHYSVVFGWNLETWRIFGHSDWAPSRESDPSGPSIWMKPRDKKEQWNLEKLRTDVIKRAIKLVEGI